MSNAWRLRLLVSLALMGGAAPGCGGDDGAECGTGTVEVDGECLPAETACGMGTVYDATARTCVTAIECAEGTMLMGTECVPDGSVVCGGNTIFDTETGTCVPDPEALCEGDLVFVMETATCVDPDELLEGMADVQELAEPNDPTFNETAMAQPVDIADGSGSFYGCVEPMDFDGDGVLDADNDFFSVEVDGPTLLRVRTDGIRGANAAVQFIAATTEGPLAETEDRGAWLRLVASLSGDGADKKVFLPAAGTYILVAADARSVFFGEPAGGADQCYFVQLDTEDLPTPTTVTPGTPVEGDFDEPRFFAMTGTRGQLLFSTLSELVGGEPSDREATASGMVTLVDEGVSSHAFEADGVVSGLAAGLAAGDVVWFVVDTVYDLALDSTEFQLLIDDGGAVEIPEDGSIDITHSDEFVRWGFFEATAGDVVHLTIEQADGDSLSLAVFQPSLSGFRLCDGCSTADEYVQIVETGIHYLQLFNQDGTDGDDYGVTFSRDAITPTALARGTASEASLADHDRALFTADLRTADWIEWSAANLVNATNVQISLYPRDRFGSLDGFLTAADGGVLAADSVIERILRGEGTQVLVSVTDDDGVDGDETFDLLLDDVDFVDLGTVMPGTDITRTAETAAADGEPTRYLLEGAAFTALTIGTTTATATLDAVIDVVDADVDVIESFDDTGAGAAESAEYLMAADWVAFVVYDDSGVGGMYDLTISSEPPPYTFATGALPFTSVCPSEGGAGTDHAVSDLDDGISETALAIPGDLGFELFGAGVSEATISTNGWLTFTPAYAGSSSLGASVNQVIAPMATDLVMDSLCTHRDGSRLIVEWRGATFDFFGAGEPVEMQAVLHGGGRIDFIYGPGHVALAGTVGLVNEDGSIRYTLDTLEAFPSSVTFTPAP
jgi:hypothetical protein